MDMGQSTYGSRAPFSNDELILNQWNEHLEKADTLRSYIFGRCSIFHTFLLSLH